MTEEAFQSAVGVPARPASVPAAAEWLADQERWELAERGPDGEKQGAVRQWRPDGTLYLRGQHEGGRLAGPFAIYHPNGEVARQGAYVDGELDGLVTAFGCAEESPEVLRGCCVPDNAWQLKSRYRRGQLEGDTFFDRAGFPLLSDGTRRPERPEGLPDGAEFDEFAGRWGAGATDENGAWTGPWRFWTTEGLLDEEAEYRETRKVWSRQYHQGAIRHEINYEGDAIHHGPFQRRFVTAEESPHADGRIVEERGRFEHGQPVGPWTFLDAAGTVVRAVDLGKGAGEDIEDRPVFADEVRPAEAWARLAETLRAEGNLREAICAAARAAARSASPDALRALLQETTVPMNEAASARAAAALSDEKGTVAQALSALVGGADAAAVLRPLGALLKGAPQASADLVEAAILLAPERRMAYMTRALMRIELGDPDGARADADRVEPETSEAASFLRTYCRLLFPTFDFWPRREPPRSTLEDLPDAPVQPLPAVRRTIQLYASRLALARATLAALRSGAAWLPPDVSALLPEGPVELAAYDAEIVDETDQGPESSTVRVDETLDLEGWNVPSLMRLCRSHWAALSWLCWSAGLEEVALPEAIEPPEAFAQAAGMAIARYWRAQDAVNTGGLRALTNGVPGFTWEGLEIEGIPRHFAEMAQEEYLEIRSVFLFLMSPENVSPFQADLRAA